MKVDEAADEGCLPWTHVWYGHNNPAQPCTASGCQSYPLRVTLSSGLGGWRKRNCDSLGYSGDWVWFPNVELNSPSTPALQALKPCRFSWFLPSWNRKRQAMSQLFLLCHIYTMQRPNRKKLKIIIRQARTYSLKNSSLFSLVWGMYCMRLFKSWVFRAAFSELNCFWKQGP